jgi:hypothetical protein
MTLPGETIATGAASTCPTCEREVDYEVTQSASGYYAIYTYCDCGPYSRESIYYPEKEQADEALETMTFYR